MLPTYGLRLPTALKMVLYYSSLKNFTFYITSIKFITILCHFQIFKVNDKHSLSFHIIGRRPDKEKKQFYRHGPQEGRKSPFLR
jgi:hypothetical protein